MNTAKEKLSKLKPEEPEEQKQAEKSPSKWNTAK